MFGRWPAAAAIALLGSLASGAAAQGLETAIMPGQVISGHAKLEGDCKNCHVRFNRGAQTGLCLDCHKDVARDVAQRRHYHGHLPEKDCRACHTDHKGRGANIAPIDAKTFDHRGTDFMLRGGHASSKVECKSCHVPAKKFREAPTDCYGCHQKNDKHEGKLGKNCADCHTEVSWKQTRFDHSKTRFPLRNRHTDVLCKNCHEDPGFKGARMECVACHKKDDDKTGHHGKFGAKCESCHTDQGWKSTIFNHNRDTKYPLKGLHQVAKCQSCHRGMLYQDKLPTACVSCHRNDDMKKGHQGKFGDKCESCHVEKGWNAPTFNHDRDTKFKLKGRHEEAECVSCHKGFLYKQKLATACVACHRDDDMKKGHQGKLGDKCESCHTENAWTSTTFNHDRDTKFPLKDKHAQAKCASCHKGGSFKEKLPSACVACHRDDDMKKGHQGRFGEKCESCHVAKGWNVTTFDHGRDTRYPLRGKHVQAKCAACHIGILFTQKLSSACATCHDKDDQHKGQLGRQCESCHTESDWKQARIDHGLTRFPLLGKHAKVKCQDCHATPRFKDANTECYACHRKDDRHKQRLGTRCGDCHDPRDWKRWDFDHDRRTSFVLDGKHRGLECLACHKYPTTGRVSTPSACVACHDDEDVHNGGFGRQCQRCHVTSSFKSIKSGGAGRLFQ